MARDTDKVLERYRRTKAAADDARRELDRAEGALAAVKARLYAKYGFDDAESIATETARLVAERADLEARLTALLDDFEARS